MKNLSLHVVQYTASLEGMVQEMYLDSEGVATWALGVTNKSGHQVNPRYKDNPQPLQKCCDVSVWLMREAYLPSVLRAFKGYDLNEAELAAALSFQWNTGSIEKTEWVSLVKHGQREAAKKFLKTHYLNNGTLTSRRASEAALFFDEVWPHSMLVPIYPVRKPSYAPNFAKGRLVDLTREITEALSK